MTATTSTAPTAPLTTTPPPAAVTPLPFAVSRAGVQLRGRHWSAPQGSPTVLLLPGGGQTAATWTATARFLASAGLGALVVDIRGHGESDRSPDADYRVDALVEDLAAVSAALESPPVVVGASLSGLVALLVAGERPGCVRALVMVDIAVDNQMTGVDHVRRFMASGRGGFDTLEELAGAVARFTGTERGPVNRTHRHASQGEDGRWYWHWDPAFIDHQPDFPSVRDRLVAAARRMTMPTLLVRGQQSAVVTEHGAAELRALLPHAESLDVAGAGHTVTDGEDTFARRLAGFALGLPAA